MEGLSRASYGLLRRTPRKYKPRIKKFFPGERKRCDRMKARARDQRGKVRVQVINGRFVGYAGGVIPAAEDGDEEDCLDR